MDKSTAMIRRQNWLKIINECNNRASGTKKDWCTANGIDVRRFYYWQRHLRQLIADQMLPIEKEPENQSSDAKAVQLPANAIFADITPMLEHEQAKVPVHDIQDHGASIPELVIRIGDCHILVNSGVCEQTLVKTIRGIRNA